MIRLPSIIPLIFFCIHVSFAQTETKSVRVTVGLEQDILPYLTGGYYGAAWIGYDKVRLRVVTAKVNKPNFIAPDGFTKNSVTAYAILVDYFKKSNWEGWNIGTGIVFWNSNIENEVTRNAKNYKNVLINGTLSYTVKLGKKIYLTPWTGMHLLIGGVKEVTIDNKSFKPWIFNPEASVKIGVFF